MCGGCGWGLSSYGAGGVKGGAEVIQLQIILQQKEVGLWLVPGKPNTGKADRENFKNKMRKIRFTKFSYIAKYEHYDQSGGFTFSDGTNC